MKILLHACCGPCSLEPVRLLRAAGHDLTIAYMNSNIAPADEYAHRLSTLRAWAAGEQLDVLEGAYDPAAWETCAGRVGAAEGDPARRKARCRACYRLRFEEAAALAAEQGFDALGTTLSVSPYQYTDVIREELERAASAAGVQPLFEDLSLIHISSTWLMEWFAIVMNVHLMSSDCMLPLMRWNTTTVSYSEYPRMVSSAAMVFGFTSRPTSAYTVSYTHL